MHFPTFLVQIAQLTYWGTLLPSLNDAHRLVWNCFRSIAHAEHYFVELVGHAYFFSNYSPKEWSEPCHEYAASIYWISDVEDDARWQYVRIYLAPFCKNNPNVLRNRGVRQPLYMIMDLIVMVFQPTRVLTILRLFFHYVAMWIYVSRLLHNRNLLCLLWHGKDGNGM